MKIAITALTLAGSLFAGTGMQVAFLEGSVLQNTLNQEQIKSKVPSDQSNDRNYVIDPFEIDNIDWEQMVVILGQDDPDKADGVEIDRNFNELLTMTMDREKIEFRNGEN